MIPKLSRNLFFLFAITVFAFASVVLTLFNYNPNTSNQTVFLNFYGSLLIMLTGVFSLTLYLLKNKNAKNETVYHIFWPSVRQGLFIGICLTTLLYLQGTKVLDPLITVSIIIITILLELFFESKKIKTS